MDRRKSVASLIVTGMKAAYALIGIQQYGLRRTVWRAASVATGDETLAGNSDARDWLTRRVVSVLGEEFGAEHASEEAAMVTFATKPEFGDFQCNAALALAQKVGEKPRTIAERLRSRLAAGADYFEFEVAGPGFLNAKLTDTFLATMVETLAEDAEVAKARTVQKVVVDYSSPNVAKDMHVGHLRSTVIGDAIANALESRGHSVIRQNHIGDWGTQFGMLIEHLQDQEEQASDQKLSNLVAFYKAAKQRFDTDEAFKARARARVVELQSGTNETTTRLWQDICEASRLEFAQVYDRLGISTELEERGESTYNDFLADIVEHLQRVGLAVESEGALIVTDDNDPDGPPLIVKKSDGGYNYATTDLAAARYRARELGADRVLYVTDAGQALHFRQVFRVAKRSGLVPEDVSLEHIPFGLVQGEDGKKFKTRAGDTVKLKDLLDEAERRAQLVAEDGIDFAAIGIGAVKYADLSLNRESNYKFSFDKMLALNGNTAPYMLYSMARISGISRQMLGQQPPQRHDLTFTEIQERNLARMLALLSPIVAEVDKDLKPNVLCDYLFNLAQSFNRFYEACPVKQAPTPQIAYTRICLCNATKHALHLGLTILGIKVLDRL